MKAIKVLLVSLLISTNVSFAADDSEEVIKKEESTKVNNSKKNKKELGITTQQSLTESLKKRNSAYNRRKNLKRPLSHRDEISAKRVELIDKLENQ